MNKTAWRYQAKWDHPIYYYIVDGDNKAICEIVASNPKEVAHLIADALNHRRVCDSETREAQT